MTTDPTTDPTIAMELKDLRTAYWRYETVRRMTVSQFENVCKLNVTIGTPFDQIIDELRPFYFPNEKP